MIFVRVAYNNCIQYTVRVSIYCTVCVCLVLVCFTNAVSSLPNIFQKPLMKLHFKSIYQWGASGVLFAVRGWFCVCVWLRKLRDVFSSCL